MRTSDDASFATLENPLGGHVLIWPTDRGQWRITIQNGPISMSALIDADLAEVLFNLPARTA